MEALDDFKVLSGLIPSIPKSMAYFCNILDHVKLSILSIMPFEEGKLPVKYLGVPLISSRLLYKDCKILVENVHNRIGDWKNKSLSFAGRLQLVKSVLSSMHLYWASVFILPTRIIQDLEQLMRGFLWCQGEMKRGKAKVAWENICFPKSEGGLGVRRLDTFNISLMVTHIWSIVSNKESLWVRWIHSYKLMGRSFWDVPPTTGMSWGWRKLLQIRNIIREHIWYHIGDGKKAFVWFDKWCDDCPLRDLKTVRQITSAGFDLKDKVADVIEEGAWKWQPNWIQIHVPPISPNLEDKLLWRDFNGDLKEFSVSLVWDTIRPRNVVVPWLHVVWYSQCIPRHAFLLWLIMLKKLIKTQDLLRQWDISHNTNFYMLQCPLCETQPDSHEHLFFECAYSSQVWSYMRGLAFMDNIPSRMEDIVAALIPISSKSSIKSVIARLVVAASSYFIWQERNNRIFKKSSRKVEKLRDVIITIIRLKLMSLRFKKSANVARCLDHWQIPKYILPYGL